MKALIHLMGPDEEPRVQAHAASAVVNFCEHLDGNIMGLYLKSLNDRFLALLSSPNQLVVEGGLTAMSSVTDSAQVRRTSLPALDHLHCLSTSC
jgi:hypothetical protein